MWVTTNNSIQEITNAFISTALLWCFNLLIIAFLIVGELLIISLIGTPLSAKRVERCLESVGFKDKSGETPMLLSRYKEAKAEVFEFFSPTIPMNEFERKQADIETALNVNIVSIGLGKDFQHILIKCVPANRTLPDKIEWSSEKLLNGSLLALGESQLDVVTADLKVTPHILVGGSSGSGKSVLLKLMLMQCIEKGYDVYIADFKGGVDFSTGFWERKCEVVTTQEKLIKRLDYLVRELEARKELFCKTKCSDIGQYNRLVGCELHRVVFGCDEISELLDKTGLDKESKSTVAEIESKLSVIARQGRAFGIHLLLATQRPDSEILKGQIKNNIDFRICGRADKVLSQIILDNSEGAEKIPKDKQGVFLTNTGVLFKAYYFNDSEW